VLRTNRVPFTTEIVDFYLFINEIIPDDHEEDRTSKLDINSILCKG
jgi:hypothetical protein